MSDDQSRPQSGGDPGIERALDQLRAELEQLAGRMGAGFREDLAQIRAIAASVAERDVTADIEALRVDVTALVARDVSAELRDDIAALRSDLAKLVSGAGVAAGVRAELEPLQSTVERISARLDDDSGRSQVLTRFQAIESRLDEIAASAGTGAVVDRLDALEARLDSLATSKQVGNLVGDLRAHLADALGGLDGDSLMRELAALRSELGDGDGTVVEQLQDNLADVASGEVVGALWDEVRQLRADLPDILAEPGTVTVAHEPDPQLAALNEELTVLRTELAEGLVVEPSDALSASLDALKAEVDGLRTALGEMRSATERTASEPAHHGHDDELLEHLGTIRAGIDELKARLDDGVVLADDLELRAPVAPAEPVGTRDVDAIADQVAALRDFVASELDTVRQTVSARLDAAAEATAASLAAARPAPEVQPEPAPPAAVHAAVDPEAIDMLRDEIRAAGAISDQVVDALRDELKALRRRIAVKAAERVLDEQQLAQIADAVADRLAQDRADG